MHNIPVSKVLEQLHTSKQGLKPNQKTGQNVITQDNQTSNVQLFFQQFTNFFAVLLLIGSLLSFIAEQLSPGQGNLYIGIALLAVVLLNATFTFYQQYQSNKIMRSFESMIPKNARVRRGNVITLPARDLVIGDIILLSEGDQVPADARIIVNNKLLVDNSPLTGESEPQPRTTGVSKQSLLTAKNMVFNGTYVVSGNAEAVVTSVGMNTQIGSIVKLTQNTQVAYTPLQKEIQRFIKIISSIAIMLGVTFYGVSFFIGNNPVYSLVFAIGIIVANVPEGLLPTVTLALSMASKRMAKNNALIKNLESVETLGSTTVICTDKTGTLTENKLTVTSTHGNIKQILQVAVHCNNSTLDHGDPTEIALHKFAAKHKITADKKRTGEEPFTSRSRRMITVHDNVKYMKGAPETVLKLCKHTDSNTMLALQKMTRAGQRVLAFATYKNKWVFNGFLGLSDPVRKDVPRSVKECHKAGIRVMMITGDNATTARTIAKKCNIIVDDVIEGDQLERMPDDKLRKVVTTNVLFARALPHHKLRIVQALQANKEIVTVTGDGVNDAPALKHADMGVAMGLVGTDVAREASNMVLMDDNFATIVKAVKEGRIIYDNIKKFISYILTSNIPEILPFIAFVLLQIPLPMTVILILCIDLGTDLIPALALGQERAENNVMKPRKKEKLFTWPMLLLSYGVYGMIEAAAGFTAYFHVLYTNGWVWGQELAYTDPLYQKAITAFFTAVIVCQMFNLVARRTRYQSSFKNLFRNKLLWFGITTEIVLLTIIIYAPWTQPFFNSHPLTYEILFGLPFGAAILILEELRKTFKHWNIH